MKLKKSILAILIFFSLVPLCIFGTFSIYEMNQKIDYMIRCNLEAISENQISNIQKFTTERKLQMEKIGNYQLVMDAIKSHMGTSDAVIDQEYLDNILREQKKYGTYVASVSVMDKEFHVVASSEQYTLFEISDLKYVDEKFHTGEFTIGNVYERRTDDGLKKVVAAYIGVYDDGELIGYVSEELDTAYFDNLRLNMDSVSKGTFYLLDGNYGIITAGDNSTNESLGGFVTNQNERSDFQEKWNQIDKEKNPRGEITYHYGADEYITYYADVENTEWSIRISENMTAQKQDLKSRSLFLVLLLVSLGLGIVVVQVFLTQKILGPIKEALTMFQCIEQTQNYSLRMPKLPKNEMGELMDGINELLNYIEVEKIHEKMTQHELRQQAESDPLTGIKNKKTIEKNVMDMVALSASEEIQITMGFLDIDDFRRYNTEYGHQQADEVICYVANVLKDKIRGEVGRIGGDEFLFCYAGTKEEGKIKEEAEEILAILEKGFINPQNNLHIAITCSLGIVTAKSRDLDYLQMVRMADQAMYEAKNGGKNAVVVRTCI